MELTDVSEFRKPRSPSSQDWVCSPASCIVTWCHRVREHTQERGWVQENVQGTNLFLQQAAPTASAPPTSPNLFPKFHLWIHYNGSWISVCALKGIVKLLTIIIDYFKSVILGWLCYKAIENRHAYHNCFIEMQYLAKCLLWKNNKFLKILDDQIVVKLTQSSSPGLWPISTTCSISHSKGSRYILFFKQNVFHMGHNRWSLTSGGHQGAASLSRSVPLPGILILLLLDEDRFPVCWILSRSHSLSPTARLIRCHIQQVAACHFGCVYLSEQTVKRHWWRQACFTVLICKPFMRTPPWKNGITWIDQSRWKTHCLYHLVTSNFLKQVNPRAV